MQMTLSVNLRALLATSLGLFIMEAAGADFERPAQPSMVFVTQTGCHFCDRLDEAVISPLEAYGLFDGTVRLVRLSIDPGSRVTDVDGQNVAAVDFAARYGAYGTPTLLFLDAQGQAHSEALYGVPDAIDFYGAKIEAAVGRLAQSQ